MSSRKQCYLPAILLIALTLLVGCNAGPGVADPDGGGSANPDSQGMSGDTGSTDPDAGAVDSNQVADDGTTSGTEDQTSTEPPSTETGDPVEPSAEALPDFSLDDVNPASARYGLAVSPRDYLGEVSAWYFGHST